MLSVPRASLAFHVLEPAFDGDATLTLRYEVRGDAGDRLAAFAEVVVLPGAAAELDRTALDQRDRALRLLALAAGLSYYKTCIPARIVVPWGLTAGERDFLARLVRGGLAEFAYRNDRPEALRPVIEAPEVPAHDAVGDVVDSPRRPLVAVGGGKDSVVTIETVRRLPVDVTLFSVNEYAPIRATAEHSGLPLLVARRTLDPLLFELNAQGALNGHVPVTAVNSLIACLSALRAGHDAVVFSNEASSSASNLTWEGVDVNHQWSKGLELEALLRELVAGPRLTYFSFLRPLSELAIMRAFARLTDYHPVFTSCNRAFHLDESKRRLWCGECPKCRFVFLCLAPFVSRDQLLAIFTGRDLLADPAQREGFLALLNVGGRLKPFECVGEPDECRVALTLLARHPDWHDHPFLADPDVQGALADESSIASVFAFHDDHFLPEAFEKAVRELL